MALGEPLFGAAYHRGKRVRRVRERAHDRTRATVSTLDLSKAFGRSDAFSYRPRCEVAVGQRRRHRGSLVLECGDLVRQPVSFRLEPRARVVRDEAGEALEAVPTYPQGSVERVEPVDNELGRVADVVQVRRRYQEFTIIRADHDRDLLGAQRHAFGVGPTAPEGRE